MSPNIRDIMGFTGLEEAEGESAADFDLDKMLAETDAILAARPGAAAEPAPEADPNAAPAPTTSEVPAPSAPAAAPTGHPLPVEPAAPGTAPTGEVPTPTPIPTPVGVAPVAPTPTEADPFGLLPAERRAALLELDRVLIADPAKREQITRVLIGGEAPAPTAAAPAAPARPTLPPEIDPGSYEARMWEDNQALREQIAQLDQTVRGQAQRTEEQQRADFMARSAQAAAQSFAQRYHSQLDPADVMRIAQTAGNTGVAGAYAAAPAFAGNLQGAYEKAMEAVLWTEPELRSKVLAPPVVTPAATPTPTAPSPEATSRKRNLTALSSSASPVSGPVGSPPLENRPDGRLTDTSRRTVVEQAASALRAYQSGGSG